MDEDAVAREIVALARDWNSAIVSNDADKIGEFMTDDWVIVSWSGVTGRDDFLAYVRSGALGHTRMEPASEPRVRIHGDVATLVVRVVSTAQYGGADIDADEWTSDVFVRADGRWRCALTHITPVSPTS